MTNADILKACKRRRVVVSVGYQDHSLEELIELLQNNEVELLIDVRLSAHSRLKDLRKTSLAKAAKAAGITYLHEPLLGNPNGNQKALSEGLPEARIRYMQYLEDGGVEALESLLEHILTSRIALLGFNREHDKCHRSCIVEVVQRDLENLRVRQI